MSNQPLEKDLDPTPLVNAIIEKTKARRLKWEATASPNTFITSVGGNTTFKIYVEEDDMAPTLCWLDEKGKTVSYINHNEVKGGLWPLFHLAHRIGNRLDERMETLMEVVRRL